MAALDMLMGVTTAPGFRVSWFSIACDTARPRTPRVEYHCCYQLLVILLGLGLLGSSIIVVINCL